MSRKNQIEDKIIKIYQEYLNKDLGISGIYDYVCDIEENQLIELTDEEVDDYYDEYYTTDWIFNNNFIVFDGNVDRYDKKEYAIKAYIGLERKTYKEALKKIVEFAVENSDDIIQFKARRIPSNDCVVFRFKSLKMIDKINDFIEKSGLIKKEMLTYNPFIPRKDSLMITPDFKGDSYNGFIREKLFDYFKECKENNYQVNIETFIEYLTKNKEEHINSFYDVLLDSLNNVPDTEILTRYLLLEVIILNKIDTLFTDVDKYNDIDKFIFDKQKHYDNVKKELGFSNLKASDERFKNKLESYVSQIKKRVEKRLEQESKEKIHEFIHQTILPLKEKYTKEEMLEQTKNIFNSIDLSNCELWLAKLINLFNSLITYDDIFNNPNFDIREKMYMEIMNKLSDNDKYKQICSYLKELYQDKYIIPIYRLAFARQQDKNPANWYTEENLEKFLDKVSSVTTMDVFLEIVENNKYIELKPNEFQIIKQKNKSTE